MFRNKLLYFFTALIFSAPGVALSMSIDFEDLTPRDTYTLGDTFSTNGVDVRVGNFQYSDGTNCAPTGSCDYALVDGRQLAGGSGIDMHTRNVSLGFDFGYDLDRLALRFGEYGGNLNLGINGQFFNFENFAQLDGATLAGTAVSVLNGFGNDTGGLLLSGYISSFVIGGQELWIDDLHYRPYNKVPEPASILLLGLGLIGWKWHAWRSASKCSTAVMA